MSPAITGTAACSDDRAGIHFRHDEMHRRAMLLHAGCERAAWVSSPLNAGSRAGWMLSMRPAQRVDEPRRQQAHEAGEADEIDAVRFECRLQRALERFAVLAERRVIDDRRRDAGLARAREARRRPAGWRRRARSRPDSLGPSPPRSAPPCWSRGRRSGWRRACEPCVSPREIEPARCIATRGPSLTRDHFAEPHDGLAFARRSTRVTASASPRCDHGHHADAAIERAQHFLLGDARPPSRAI